MGVISTDKWLQSSWDHPIKLCEKLKKHFTGVSASEIYRYLTMHGMYEHPLKNGVELIQRLKKNNIWKIIEKEEEKLRKQWDGPKIPIYIFPSDPYNQELRKNFNGKAGLAFSDKLFLFVSENNSKNEIKALLTHEYNHICRLNQFEKKEEDYVLLDTIILEGLAENAVFEHFSDKYTADWTSYYSDTELEDMWSRLILPNCHLSKYHRKHHVLLYGIGFYPKMVGYCVGYYLVHRFLKKNQLTSKELLRIPSSKIAQVQER